MRLGSGGRGDVDDRPAARFQHRACALPHSEEDAGLVDRDDVRPCLVADLGQRVGGAHACIVDESVDLAEPACGEVDDRFPVARAGDVERPIVRAAAKIGFDRGPRRSIPPAENDVCALANHPADLRLAHSAGAARKDDIFFV